MKDWLFNIYEPKRSKQLFATFYSLLLNLEIFYYGCSRFQKYSLWIKVFADGLITIFVRIISLLILNHRNWKKIVLSELFYFLGTFASSVGRIYAFTDDYSQSRIRSKISWTVKTESLQIIYALVLTKPARLILHPLISMITVVEKVFHIIFITPMSCNSFINIS